MENKQDLKGGEKTKEKSFKYRVSNIFMKKMFSLVDMIIIFWAYFIGILLTSELFSRGIIRVTDATTQGIISIIVGFAFVYFIIKIIEKAR